MLRRPWIVLLAAVSLAACGNHHHHSSTPTATATAAGTGSPPASATPKPTNAPTATSTPQNTATATASPTATSTRTPSIADELEAAGLGKYLGTTAAEVHQNGIWKQYLFETASAGPICLFGGQYQTNVHRGTNDHVLLYLEGGGACWSYQTCIAAPLGVKQEGKPISLDGGVLEFDNPDNPFKDWNVVYGSYCDGSVFIGDNVADYQGTQAYHHGLQNLSATVSVMRDEFPNPDLIVVAGYSGGGYGTFAGYGVTRVAYPDQKILVLDDSGPGLQNPDDAQGVQDRNQNWNYQQFIPTSCTRCAEQYSYLTEWSFERDPTLRTALISYLNDAVISSFLALDGASYETLLRTVSGNLHDDNPDRFKRFFFQGASHTILELSIFYTKGIDGITTSEWTTDFLTDGPKWQDLIEEPSTP